MRGSYDEIKVVGFGVHCELPFQMGLQAKLHAESDTDLVFIFFPELQEFIQIGICVQVIQACLAGRIDIIGVKMLCDTDMCQSKRDRSPDHFFHRGIAVPGKTGVDVVVCFYRHMNKTSFFVYTGVRRKMPACADGRPV